MDIIDSELIGRVVGHSTAEHVFRPWWDTMEDMFIYGLLSLGLVLVPTAMVTGSPLQCTFCKDELCHPVLRSGHWSVDPGYCEEWVRQFCTFNGSVEPLLLYFPYILLIIAFIMVVIEKIFMFLFRSNKKLEKLYKLLLDQNILSGENIKHNDNKNKQVIEIEETYKNSEDNYFNSYLIRTVLELIVISILLLYLIFNGVHVLFYRNNIIFCNINGYFYACSGHPQEFYQVILIITIFIIICYIITNIYNLIWIIEPNQSKIHCILSNYRQNLLKRKRKKETERLNEVYFNNKDMGLLSNLLVLKYGIGLGLRVVGLFDQNFNNAISCKILNVKYNSRSNIQVIIEKPSDLLSSSIRRIPNVRMKMLVELVYVEKHSVLVFEVLKQASNVIIADFINLGRGGRYLVKVSLLVNGCSISHVERQFESNDIEMFDDVKSIQDGGLESFDYEQTHVLDQFPEIDHHFKSE